MLFRWLKYKRRHKIQRRPPPPRWRQYLEQNIAYCKRLRRDEWDQLLRMVQVFVAEKKFEGCGGLTVNEEMKVTIAGQACLMLLGIEHDYFHNVRTILVYPTGYAVPSRDMGPDGVITEDTEHVLGEVQHRGPVVLSWDNTLRGSRDPRDGHNLVLHEFAHKLDMLDGLADGTPPIKGAQRFAKYVKVMTSEYEKLCDHTRRGRATLLDKYGATDPAEFFAVCTECFFEKSVQMRRKHRELYGVLSAFYGQDPAMRGCRV